MFCVAGNKKLTVERPEHHYSSDIRLDYIFILRLSVFQYVPTSSYNLYVLATL